MSTRSIPVLSKEKEEFELPLSVVEYSGLLKEMTESLGIDLHYDQDPIERIELANCSTFCLQQTINFCQFYAGIPSRENIRTKEGMEDYDIQIKKFNEMFWEEIEDRITEVLLCANYLDIQIMVDLLCNFIAEAIRGNTAEEMRQFFNVENDYTEEELERVKRENDWSSKNME
uniref:Skp1-related protein n=1 Tax=Rhabditophanes sp. KR3021 TaxID=114890 RepID=A0AC35TTF0_9BILA